MTQMEEIQSKLDLIVDGMRRIEDFEKRLARQERWRDGGSEVAAGAEWRLSTVEAEHKARKKVVGVVVGGALAAIGAAVGGWAMALVRGGGQNP